MIPFKKFVFLACMSVLASCAQNKEKTQAKFSLSFGALSSGLGKMAEGGAMVFAKEAGGRTFGRLIQDANTNVSEDVPNGIWSFYAIAWEGGADSGPFTGVVRCAESGPLILKGDAINVDLLLKNSNCESSSFAGSRSLSSAPTPTGSLFTAPNYKKFLGPMYETCKSLENSNFVNSAPTYFSTCQYVLDTGVASKGYATGYKIALQDFDLAKTDGIPVFKGAPLESKCSRVSESNAGGPSSSNNGAVTGLISPSALSLPYETSFMLGMKVKAFFSGFSVADGQLKDCDPNSEAKEIPLFQGITKPYSTPGPNGQLQVAAQFDPINIGGPKLFIRTDEADVCKGSRLAANDFAGGYGNPGHPWLICNYAQLNLVRTIYDNPGYNGYNKAFKLLKNINRWSGITASNLVPPPNFDPIGSSFEGGGAQVSTEFTGHFDGNNNTVVGLNVEVEDSSVAEVGIFRNIGFQGRVENLILIHPEVHAKKGNRIGIIAGKSLGTIKNIHITSGEVEGYSHVGGIVGHVQNIGSVLSSTTQGQEIRAKKMAGGIVGLIDSTSGAKIYEVGAYHANIRLENGGNFCLSPQPQATCMGGSLSWQNNQCIDSGKVENTCSGTWEAAQYAGGIVGRLVGDGSVTISSVVAEAHVSGDSIIGGIAGSIDNSIINDAYSISVVLASNSGALATYAGRAGGIVGNFNQGALNRTFFTIGSVSGNLQVGPIFGSQTGLTCNDTFATGAVTTGTGCATTKDYALTRQLSNYPVATWLPTTWVQDPGSLNKDFPRLKWETPRPCDGKFGATSNGSGTALSPYLICNREQFALMQGSAANYLLANHIDLTGTTSDYIVTNFNGTLNGNKKFVTNFERTTVSSAGLFDTLGPDAKLKDLYLRGFRMMTPSATNRAPLAKINNGIIENVSAHCMQQGAQQIGGLVSVNNKVIASSSSSGHMDISTGAFFGGIAAKNNGIISQSRTEMFLNIISGTPQNIGGIVGGNLALAATLPTPLTYYPKEPYRISDGTIIPHAISVAGLVTESTFRGNMKTTTGGSRIGGVVGLNEGSISNVISEWTMEDTSVSGTYPVSEKVGGIVGYSIGGSITYSATRFYPILNAAATDVNQKWHALGITPSPLENSYSLESSGSILSTPRSWLLFSRNPLFYDSSPSVLTLTTLWPGIIGEENDNTSEDEKLIWILDPSDSFPSPRLRRVEDHSNKDMIDFVLSWASFQ